MKVVRQFFHDVPMAGDVECIQDTWIFVSSLRLSIYVQGVMYSWMESGRVAIFVLQGT